MEKKRVHAASSSLDVETLGHISRVLSTNEAALDLVSLHVELPALVSCALGFVEEYDCEAVGTSTIVSKCVFKSWLSGDPQSAVSNLGDVVLFAQLAIARFKVAS